MERLELDEAALAECTAFAQQYYPGRDSPCAGSTMQIGDDLVWAGCIVGRVVWGYDLPDWFVLHSPDWFGTSPLALDVGAVTDRAPLDPETPPFPIYPDPTPIEQPQQMVPDGHEHQMGGEHRRAGHAPRHFSVEEQRRLLGAVLARLPDDAARERARAKIRASRPELLADEHEHAHDHGHDLGDHRHDAIPPSSPHKGER